MNETVIIVAGGRGSRMGAQQPKQFMEILGKPIILQTIDQFINYNNKIELIIGLPKAHFDTWDNLCKKYNFDYSHTIVQGGTTRFETVKNCLKKVKNKSLIAIHDSVRPCIPIKTISTAFKAAEKHGAVIPVIPVIDSLRMVQEDCNSIADRKLFRAVQTPQTFQYEILYSAYEQSFNIEFTDDASVVEKFGHSIFLVEGDYRNIKITTPTDLLMAEQLLKDFI